MLREYTEVYCRFDFYRIVDKMYYFSGHLIWDWDGNAGGENIDNYILRPDSGYITRECALDFARAISEGLLEKITKWIQTRKEEAEREIKNLEQK